MRAITSEIVRAFLAGKARTLKNTSTDGRTLFLHGNAIARRVDGVLSVTLAGWNTTTTRDRVNAVLDMCDEFAPVRFAQRDYSPVLIHLPTRKVCEVDSREWYTVAELRTLAGEG